MVGLYTYRWQKARLQYLRTYPLCVMCGKKGLFVKADVVDHIVPHKGDMNLFWDRNNWQALCYDHHNVDKQRMELGGRERCEPDADGWPSSG